MRPSRNRFISISGFSQPGDIRQATGSDDLTILGKPFTNEKFLTTLFEVITSHE